MTEPTDDELLAVLRDVTGATVFSGDEVADCRLGIEAPTLDEAIACMSFSYREPLARALRSRFPQPITDAVLRAEGFEPDVLKTAEWVQEIGTAFVSAVPSEGGLRIGVNQFGYVHKHEVRTPDALHDVVEHLRGLYAPGEDA